MANGEFALEHRQDDRFGLRWSVLAHATILVLFFVKTTIFPGKTLLYIPSLKVDLVGLPDVLKKDLKLPGDIKEALKDIEEDAHSIKPKKLKDVPKDVAAPDEMALNKPKSDEKLEKVRGKKMKSALDRIKALEKITGQRPEVIKGNIISKGSSLAANAKEGTGLEYPDKIREKLQDKWALPVWLSRQKFSAQVQLFIDARGRVTAFKFIKFSGNKQFDELVKRAVHESQPFAPPPESIAETLLSDGILVGFPL